MTPMAANPCNECPWRRTSWAGHLGPLDAEGWCEVAHSEAPIYCHMTIAKGSGHADPADPKLRHCAGAATFRANVGKLLRDPDAPSADPDLVAIFGWDDEFINHHRT